MQKWIINTVCCYFHGQVSRVTVIPDLTWFWSVLWIVEVRADGFLVQRVEVLIGVVNLIKHKPVKYRSDQANHQRLSECILLRWRRLSTEDVCGRRKSPQLCWILMRWAKYDLFIFAKLLNGWNADHESLISIYWETVRHKYLCRNIYLPHASVNQL